MNRADDPTTIEQIVVIHHDREHHVCAISVLEPPDQVLDIALAPDAQRVEYKGKIIWERDPRYRDPAWLSLSDEAKPASTE